MKKIRITNQSGVKPSFSNFQHRITTLCFNVTVQESEVLQNTRLVDDTRLGISLKISQGLQVQPFTRNNKNFNESRWFFKFYGTNNYILCPHNSVDPNTFKNQRPAYSMTGRTQLPGDRTSKPGPGAHSPEKVYVTMRQAPVSSFGIRHSEYTTPIIVAADM